METSHHTHKTNAASWEPREGSVPERREEESLSATEINSQAHADSGVHCAADTVERASGWAPGDTAHSGVAGAGAVAADGTVPQKQPGR